MEKQIADYLKVVCDYAREALTIGYLEGELRRRKIRSTRLQKNSEQQKANLESLLTLTQRQNVQDRVLSELQHVADKADAQKWLNDALIADRHTRVVHQSSVRSSLECAAWG